jgi:hypothetical protein
MVGVILYYPALNNRYIKTEGQVYIFKNIDDAMSGNDNLAIDVLPADNEYKITNDYDAKHYMVYQVATENGV